MKLLNRFLNDDTIPTNAQMLGIVFELAFAGLNEHYRLGHLKVYKVYRKLFEGIKTLATQVDKGELILMSAGPEKASASPVKGSMTMEEVWQGLANIGFPVECGACVGIFFTGVTLAPHTCTPKTQAPDVR